MTPADRSPGWRRRLLAVDVETVGRGERQALRNIDAGTRAASR